jgi:hypothetical protein
LFGIFTEDDDFGVSAYAVNWKHPASSKYLGFLPCLECVNYESTHYMLFPAEENGFAASSYAVNWKEDPQDSSKYMGFLTKLRMC